MIVLFLFTLLILSTLSTAYLHHNIRYLPRSQYGFSQGGIVHSGVNLPPILLPMLPYPSAGYPFQPRPLVGIGPQPVDALGPAPSGKVSGNNGCPKSPFATFLSQQEQEALHELITEARREGADENQIKKYMQQYLKEVLSPPKYDEFERANLDFEQRRRGKRETEEKPRPLRLFNLLETYSDSSKTDQYDQFSKFYNDVSVKKLRPLN